MMFRNIETGAFGLSDSIVRKALAAHSLPEDLSEANLTDFGFSSYAESSAPAATWDTRAVEIAPVDGVQQWMMIPSGETEPPIQPRRLIPKSVVQERMNDIGKLGAAFAALNSSPIFFGRWFAPDWPNVYFDDEGLMQILSAIGCTEAEVAAVTAP